MFSRCRCNIIDLLFIKVLHTLIIELVIEIVNRKDDEFAGHIWKERKDHYV